MARAKNKANKLYTQQEYADHRGVSQPCIAAYIRQGKLAGAVVRRGYRTYIDPEKADAALDDNMGQQNRGRAGIPRGQRIVDTEEDDRAGGPEQKPAMGARATRVDESVKMRTAEGAGTSGLSYQQANTIHRQYMAALAKFEYEKATGKLVDASKLERAAFDAARQIRDALLGIPARTAALVAAQADQFECKKILEEEINQVLIDLSGRLKVWEEGD